MSRHPRQSPDDTDTEEPFLSRWSKRKEQNRSAETSEPEDVTIPEAAEPPVEGTTAAEPAKGDDDMPPIESIDEKTDVSEFFSPGVSEALRKAALRKFFHSPAFNVVDGLDDYDDDFRTFKALGDIVTSDMRHQEELAKERQIAEEGRRMEVQDEAEGETAEGTVEDQEKLNRAVHTEQAEHEQTAKTEGSSSEVGEETEDENPIA